MSIGEAGVESHDTVLKPVLHKIGDMICCVRVTIIRVFIAPLEFKGDLDAAAAVLQSILAVALQPSCRKTGCLAPSACISAPCPWCSQ